MSQLAEIHLETKYLPPLNVIDIQDMIIIEKIL